MAKVSSRLKTIAKDFTKAGEQFTAVGRSLTTSFTLPIAALGIASSKTFMDFELSMSRIEGLVGLSKETVASLAEEIKKLSPDVGKAPKELAEALYFITSSGVPAAKAMDVLTMSAKASAAGLGSTAVIADAVTSAMNAYQSTGMTAAHATDILTAAVKYGKLEADQLAPSLGQVISVASTLGISFDQVAGAMAAMSMTGVDASEAATALTAIMSMLMKPTAASTKLLEAHGLSLKQLRDMSAQPGGLIEVLRTLDTTFEGDDEAIAAIVPNVRALRGVLNLLAQDSSKVDEVLQGVTNSTGATDAAFKAYSETSRAVLDTAIAQLMSSLTEVGHTIMPLVTGAIQTVTAALKEFSSWWTGLTEEQRKWIVNTALVVAAVGPVLLVIGGALKMIGTLTTAIRGVGTALAFLAAHPAVVAIMLAVAALSVVVVLATQHWNAFRIALGMATKEASATNIQIAKDALDAYDQVTKANRKTMEGDAIQAQALAAYDKQRAQDRIALEKNVQHEIDGVRGAAMDKQAVGQIKAQKDAAAAAKAAAAAVALAEQQARDAKTAAEKAAAAEALKIAQKHAEEVAKVNTDLNDKIYKLSHTTVEGQIYDLAKERDAAIAAGGSKLKADEAYTLAAKQVYDDARKAKAAADKDALDKATAAATAAQDKYLASVKDYASKQKDVLSTLTSTIIDNYGIQKTAAINAVEKERDAVVNALDDMIDKRQDELDATLDAISKEKSAALGQFDDQIQALQDSHRTSQDAITVATLRENVIYATTAQGRKQAQAALDKELADESYYTQLSSLQKQKQTTSDTYDAETKMAQSAADRELQSLKDSVTAVQKSEADRLVYVSGYYDNLMLLRNADAEAEKLLAGTTQTDIIAMLKSRLAEWKGLGTQIGDSMYSGLQSALGAFASLGVAPNVPGTSLPMSSTWNQGAGQAGYGGFPVHGDGGYFTTPHIGIIAEKGPEFVVPQSQASSFAQQMGGSDTAAQQRQMMLKMDAILSAIRQVAPGVGSAVNGLGRA